MAVVCAFLKEKGNLPQISYTKKTNRRHLNVCDRASVTILNYQM